MSVTDWKFPGTAVVVDTGQANWNNPDYVKVADTNYATCTSKTLNLTPVNTLRATNFDFSSIPSGATIGGIEVQVQRYVDVGKTAKDNTVQLRITAGLVGNNKASGVKWPTSLEERTYGGATDKWGTSIVTSDLNSYFGLDFIPAVDDNGDGTTLYVNYIAIRIYYTASAGPTKLKTWNNVSNTKLKTLYGVDIAKVKTINGVS